MKKQKNKKEHLKNAYDANPHGAGFGYVQDAKIIVKKFRDFNEFYKAYEIAFNDAGSASEFIIHFRLSTHGLNKGTYNVHPFYVSNKMIFAHNGIISNVDTHKKKSDTRCFNDDIL